MARIRTIKPELPQSESLGRVTRDARLLFVNLFTIADDAGRLRGQSRLLASLLYPFDDGESAAKTTGAEIEGWLGELEREGCIVCYEAGGVEYIQITKWLEHQKIDRPSPSRLPEYVAKPREESRGRDALPRTLDLGPTPIVPKGTVYPKAFEAFWILYPAKIGKDAALRAWKKREKAGDLPSIEEIAEAIGRYIHAKPIDREWCNPATWLNQGRWLDAPASAAAIVTTKTAISEAEWRAAGKRFLETDEWPAIGYGPQPGYGGCEVPKHIVAELNLDGKTPPAFMKRTA